MIIKNPDGSLVSCFLSCNPEKITNILLNEKNKQIVFYLNDKTMLFDNKENPMLFKMEGGDLE